MSSTSELPRKCYGTCRTQRLQPYFIWSEQVTMEQPIVYKKLCNEFYILISILSHEVSTDRYDIGVSSHAHLLAR